LQRFQKYFVGLFFLTFRMKKIQLANRRLHWGLTIYGRGLLFFILIFFFILFIKTIHPFLSKNAPVKADILIVEGYLPDYAMKDVLKEYRHGHYKMIIVSGNPVDFGFYYSRFGSTADAGRVTLLKLGLDSTKVAAAPAPYEQRDRTHAGAIAVKHYIDSLKIPYRTINLYSFGCHARRSWMLFQHTFGKQYQVGVIRTNKNSYRPERWWRYSDGVREVVDESVAYIYARFFFSYK